jgi:hypothetical protein
LNRLAGARRIVERLQEFFWRTRKLGKLLESSIVTLRIGRPAALQGIDIRVEMKRVRTD